jgi:CHAT domain-containing protein
VNDDVRLQTLSLLKLGVLHVQTERWARADSVLCEALTQAQSLGDLDYQRRILRTLGRLHEMQGDWPAAEQYYRSGVGVIEEYRESLTASQWSMTAFAQWREVYRGLVRALLAQDRPREALTILDRSRARHLQDLRTRARVANQLPPDERARLDSLSRALTDVRNRLGSNALGDGETAALRNRETSLMAARQQLLQIDSSSSRPSLDAITDRLADQNRALVSYFLDDPWPVFDRSPRSVAFVLTADTLQTISLPGLTQDSVQAQVESVSPLFTSRVSSQANAMHFDLRPLHALHDAVYAPVAEQLPPEQPLTVIPDGPLFHLPFSMLVHAMPGGRYAPSEARYVLHDRPTSLELASSLVVDSARRAADWSGYEPHLAAYGVSDFDTLRTMPSALREAAPRTVDSELVLPSLPGVRAEMEALESSVANAHVSLNGQAIEANVRRSAQRAGVLHVASHVFVNEQSPLQNAIVLRPGRDSVRGGRAAATSPESDGVLFLHELQGHQARLPMVVLSGCNTAAGPVRGGEGMEGVQYAFRAMGARSTVATLWPASDQASVELMRSFYENLQAGHPKDVALRQARLSFLESNPQEASPFFWASPTLYGSTVPLPLEAPPLVPVWGWWVLGGLGTVVLLLLLRWWRPTMFAGGGASSA